MDKQIDNGTTSAEQRLAFGYEAPAVEVCNLEDVVRLSSNSGSDGLGGGQN